MNARILILFGIVAATLYILFRPGNPNAGLSQFTGARGGTLANPSNANFGLGGSQAGGVPSEVAAFGSGINSFLTSLHLVNSQPSTTGSLGGATFANGQSLDSTTGLTPAQQYAVSLGNESVTAGKIAPNTSYGSTVGPPAPIEAPNINPPSVDQTGPLSSAFFGNSVDGPAPPVLPTAALAFDSTSGTVNSFFIPGGTSQGVVSQGPPSPFAIGPSPDQGGPALNYQPLSIDTAGSAAYFGNLFPDSTGGDSLQGT